MVKIAKSLADIPTSGLVLIDFFAVWCGPCVRIAPFFEQLATKYGSSVTFIKVDVDQSDDITAKFDITAMPTFILLKDGEVYRRMEGADRAKLEQMLA